MNPQASAPSTIVTPARLAAIGFSDHAIERFAQRAGITPTHRTIIEPLIRDLLLLEGMVTATAPRWALSRNRAPLYLQLSDWMLFILRPDGGHPSQLVAVTVINRPTDNDWVTALRRGHIGTPPPPRLHPLPNGRVDWRDCLRDALSLRRQDSGIGFVRGLLLARRAARSRAHDHVAMVSDANEELLREYNGARTAARERHVRRCVKRGAGNAGRSG